MGTVRTWLVGADTSENPRSASRYWKYNHRLQAGLLALAVGALALLSVFVPRVEGVLNVTLGVGLGLLVVGWVTKQVLEEIQLRRCYDTPAQRAEAERKGAEARRERRAAAALREAEATVEDEVVHRQG
ncbi:MAG: hypothetical protein QOD04_2252, partial [Pseudonocardiales bacterium]|nr:hypothetical protein [Pseudonocardiales bacterium]